MRCSLRELVGVSAALSVLAGGTAAQCLDWADGYAVDELGADALIYAMQPMVEDGQEVLYVGGGFHHIGGVEVFGIARWDGEEWEQLGAGINGGVLDMTSFDDGTGPALYVVGTFTQAGGQSIRHVARWKDGQWSGLGADFNHAPEAIAGHGSRLFVGGQFTELAGEPVERLAAWDGVTWERFTSGPSPRTGFAMAYDTARSEVVLFGGDDGPTDKQDTWAHDGNAWDRRAIDGADARQGHTMAYDSLRQRVLMFGGEVRSYGVDTRLWAWDGADWAIVADSMLLGREGMDIAYDAARDRLVWFGGQSSSNTYHDETWEFDGTQWWEVIPATTRPSARAHYALAYDPVRQVTVMFGGYGYDTGIRWDTWEWDGFDWMLVSESGPGPRMLHDMVFDAARGHIVMYGGHTNDGSGWKKDTWAWDGVSWTQLAPSDPNRHDDSNGPMAYDAANQVVVMRDKLGVTWIWDGIAWTFRHEGGLNDDVYDLASFDGGSGAELYSCGYFTRAGAISASRIARLGNEGWKTVGGGIQDTYCHALYEWDDGNGPDLYIGGSFNVADNQPMQSIGRWDGSAWSILNVGDPGDGGGVVGAVHTIFAYDDGSGEKLYVGGNFDQVDGPGIGYDGDVEALNIARWDGTLWEALGDVESQYSEQGVYALGAVATQGSRRLVAGGRFEAAGEKPSNNLAVWGDPCTPPAIVEQPEDVVAIELEPVIFSTRIWGTRPVTFQWRKDGTDLIDTERITGTTTDLLYIEPWLEEDAGVYDVVVTNAHGSVVSDSAGLTTFPGGNSGGIVTVVKVMLPPEPCPWDANTYINLTGPATIAPAGEGLVWAEAVENGIDALFRWTNNDAVPVVKLDDPAPGAGDGVIFGFRRELLGSGYISNGGAITLGARVSGPGITSNNDFGVWRIDEAGIAPVIREGDPAPGFASGVTIDGEYGGQSAFSFHASRGDWITFKGSLEGNGFDPTADRAIWRWSGATGAELLVQRYTPAPVLGTNVLDMWTPSHTDTSGDTLLTLSLESQTGHKFNANAWDGAMLLGSPGDFDLVARSGDPAPGFAPDMNLDQLNGGNRVLLSDGGDVVFSCRATGPNRVTGRALYHWRDGVLAPLAIEGEPAPGIPGDLPYFQAEVLAANGIGDAAFAAQLNNNACGSDCPDHAFFISLNDVVSNVAYRFMTPVAGLGDAFVYADTGRVAINDERQMIFEGTVTLNGVALTGLFGWVEDKGMFPIAVPGSQLEVLPGDVRVVVEAGLSYINIGSDGDDQREAGISADGSFLFRAGFSNGTRGVFEGDFIDFLRNFYPCVGDFNNDDNVNTLDVLAFLNAWAAKDASADINGDGTVNTLDVIEFLNEWTQGCS